MGCWAHARRNFFDARLNQPREVHYVPGLIAQLYDIEDTIRERSAAERLAARQERSVPMLERLGSYRPGCCPARGPRRRVQGIAA